MSRVKFLVETIVNEKFVKLGIVEVDLEEVLKVMEETKNIKDNMPSKFAREKARKKWPNANPIVLTEIFEGEEDEL